MNYCPITYQPCGKKRYSESGLKMLSPNLEDLKLLPYSSEEQRNEAAARASKLSIQGVQPKLSAKLNVAEQQFELVDTGGVFILKPQGDLFPELPQNEDVSMKMAAVAGIETPLHGMLWSKDGSLTYFIKRFDREPRGRKVATEDFAQLSQNTRETKYNFSMEKIAAVVEQFCTFPQIEKLKLLRLTLFSFLIGNEDMHLKNFSVISRNGKTELSPAYDLLNTSIAMQGVTEEIALPLAGKKRRLTREHFIDYYAKQRLGLNDKVIDGVLGKIQASQTQWVQLIEQSFLSDKMKEEYLDLVSKRIVALGLD